MTLGVAILELYDPPAETYDANARCRARQTDRAHPIARDAPPRAPAAAQGRVDFRSALAYSRPPVFQYISAVARRHPDDADGPARTPAHRGTDGLAAQLGRV